MQRPNGKTRLFANERRWEDLPAAQDVDLSLIHICTGDEAGFAVYVARNLAAHIVPGQNARHFFQRQMQASEQFFQMCIRDRP